MLRRIYGLLDTSIASQSALWCLFLVAFFSFLRKSNLTASSAQAFDPGKHLKREAIKFTSQGAVLCTRWSKTRQHREGILLVPLPLIPGSSSAQSLLFGITSAWSPPHLVRRFSVYQMAAIFRH